MTTWISDFLSVKLFINNSIHCVGTIEFSAVAERGIGRCRSSLLDDIIRRICKPFMSGPANPRGAS